MTEISISEQNSNDIYSLGFDKSLNRSTEDISSPVVYNPIGEAINTAQALTGGNLNLKTLTIGGLVRQVAPGDDIQAAIDAANREGGGTVQLLAKTYKLTAPIQVKGKVALVGAGANLTTLDFENRSLGLSVTGSPSGSNQSTYESDFLISNLTITGSGATAGLDIVYAKNFRIENITVSSCTGIGVRIKGANNFAILNSNSSSNTGHNWFMGNKAQGFNTHDCSQFILFNCIGNSSTTGDGFRLDATDLNSLNPDGVKDFTIMNCTATDNGLNGFAFRSNPVVEIEGIFEIGRGKFIGNNTYNPDSPTNTQNCFNIDDSVLNCLFVGNSIYGTFWIRANRNTFLGNSVIGTPVLVDDNILGNTWIGNGTDSSTIPSVFYNTLSPMSYVDDSQSTTIKENRKFVVMSDKSTPGPIRSGFVVILGASTGTFDGDDVTTTTTNGSNKVFGMSCDSTGGFHRVMVSGLTSSLHVLNSASSIIVGDWLSTGSSSGYAHEATTGEMAFAISLSAPTTSTAVISAVLVSPRLL